MNPPNTYLGVPPRVTTSPLSPRSPAVAWDSTPVTFSTALYLLTLSATFSVLSVYHLLLASVLPQSPGSLMS